MISFYPQVTDAIGFLLVPLSIVLTVHAKYVSSNWRRIALAVASIFITIIAFGRAISLSQGFEYWEGLDIFVLIASVYNAPFYLATFLISTGSLLNETCKDIIHWIKHKETRQPALDDIKMIFDGGKQIGLSLAIALSLKSIQEPMRQDLAWKESTIALVNCSSLLITTYLLILGYIWIGFSFKSKPSSKVLHWISLSTFGGVTTTIIYYLVKTDYKNITFNPWS
jgi:hypothetical protein